jgi:hypothetical protein
MRVVMKRWLKSISERLGREENPGRDRRTGLVVFGTLDILMGILCFSLAMLLLIAVSSGGLHGMKTIHFFMTMGFLFFLTAWFCTMGLGSIRARRWARALLVVGAWVAVFLSTLMLALLLHILPELYELVANSGLLAADLALGILYGLVCLAMVLLVACPLVAIAFYSKDSVRLTCERINPQPAWTDRYPLPLLAMGCICLFGCFSVVGAATTNYTVFLFGHIVSGGAGFIIITFLSAACAYVGWGAFTRKMHAWWGAYALVLLSSSSMMLTFSEVDMENLYVLMGYSTDQIEQIRKIHPFNQTALTFASCAWGVMACIYLVWVRDSFRPEAVRKEVKSYEQRKAEEEPEQTEEPIGIRMRLD